MKINIINEKLCQSLRLWQSLYLLPIWANCLLLYRQFLFYGQITFCYIGKFCFMGELPFAPTLSFVIHHYF